MKPAAITPAAERLTIYYDAKCPLCASEMEALVERDRDSRLNLVDCSPRDFTVASGPTRSELMRRIHARTAGGRWLRGIEVFVLAYRAAGFQRFAAMLAWGPLRPLWDRAYGWIADHRMGLSRLGIPQGLGRLLRR